MRPDNILEELRKRPFEPFGIQTTVGRLYEVRHPEMVMVFRSKIIIGLPDPNEPRLAGRYEVVALLHIVRLIPLHASPS